MSVGIPFIYYGTEHAYSGGSDPNNREVLFQNVNKKGPLFDFVKTIVTYRRLA